MAARFNGARGAVPVTIDGDPGGAWILAGVVKVAFAFHVEAGLVREIELIADPDVLATLDVTSTRKRREVVPSDTDPQIDSSRSDAPGSGRLP